MRISNYEDFCKAVNEIGFLPGSFPWSGSLGDKGAFSVRDFCTDKVTWHSGDPDTDPWQWRMRVVEERDDIAYAKLFQGKTGYISREWYPVFLAARRQGNTFEEAYAEGKLNRASKLIYELLGGYPRLPVYDIKSMLDIGKKGRRDGYERAIVDLQMGMYITMCGEVQKISKEGLPYGWPGAVFCRVEEFIGYDAVENALEADPDEAAERIRKRVLEITPGATDAGIAAVIGVGQGT